MILAFVMLMDKRLRLYGEMDTVSKSVSGAGLPTLKTRQI